MSPFGFGRRTSMVGAADALPGRAERPFAVPQLHDVLGTPLAGPWPEGTEVIYLGLGCFWGAEKEFWQLPGVVTTAVGYMGGFTANPTYEEVCTGRTGHTETVLVAYDPTVVTTRGVLELFWASHDPTQGNRQGNDVGTQYRSAAYWTSPGQAGMYAATRAEFAASLVAAGYGEITTDARSSAEAGPFYYAEAYHQQYLHKNPAGYCPIHATGLTCRS